LQAEAALTEDLVWSDSNSEEKDAYFFIDPKGGLSEPPT
jgi:hypothetical protein